MLVFVVICDKDTNTIKFSQEKQQLFLFFYKNNGFFSFYVKEQRTKLIAILSVFKVFSIQFFSSCLFIKVIVLNTLLTLYK